MRIHRYGAVAIFAGLVGVWAVRAQSPQPKPGDPLSGLTSAAFQLFDEGRDDFMEVEEAADGLGPAFNGRSCSECHNLPAVGGIGTLAVIRAGAGTANGFQPPPGGTLIHLLSLPDHGCQVSIPTEVNILTRRIPLAIFGDGLIEAIPDAAIRALEDPDDRNGDGVKGRAAMIMDIASNRERVGRFGWKAQQATLLSFAGDAYVNEMGITNDLFPNEVAATLNAQELAACDKVPDPEDQKDAFGLRGIDRFTNFMKYLAPPVRGPITAEVQRGEQLFATVGCATCHVPVLGTGPNPDPVLANKPVPLYSDLLLHDVDTADGIPQAAASGNEFRTPPLWGLRFRKLLLHDGSAITLQQAIRRHGRTALKSKDRYLSLSRADRDAVLAFLGSL